MHYRKTNLQMKKTTLILAVGLLCLAACAQRKGDDKKLDDKGPRNGGGMTVNKDGDSVFVALKNETLDKFQQFTFEDAVTGKTMQYNLFVPEGYDDTEAYPLLLFMADASTVGKEVTAPLTQGYGALEFASERDQKLHPSFVLVPQYTQWAVQDDWSTTDEVEMTIHLLEAVCKEYKVDRNRLYTTGQSMGGMRDLTKVLQDQGARIDSASWSAKLPAEEQEQLAEALIAQGGNINFIKWETGSVLPETGLAMEHMASFDYGYKIAAVRDWLFVQRK